MLKQSDLILGVALFATLICAPLLTKFNVIDAQVPMSILIIAASMVVWVASGNFHPGFFLILIVSVLPLGVASIFYTYSTAHLVGDLSKFALAAIIIGTLLRRREALSGWFTTTVCSVFCAATLLSSMYGGFYSLNEQGVLRFSGIIGNVNLNSYVFLLAIMHIYLNIKLSASLRANIMLVVAYIFIQFASETKSLIAAVPFIAVQWLNIKQPFSRGAMLLLLIIVSCPLYVFWQDIGAAFMLDPSLGTRWNLTNMLLDVMRGQNILPAGVGYTRSILEGAGSINAAHNDFLQYAIDLGFMFAIMFLMVLYKISSRNPQSVFFVLFYCTAALHNNLMSVYLLPLAVMVAKQINDSDKFYIRHIGNVNGS